MCFGYFSLGVCVCVAALALNQFEGQPYGDTALAALDLGHLTYWENIGILLCMSFAYRLIALIALLRRYK